MATSAKQEPAARFPSVTKSVSHLPHKPLLQRLWARHVRKLEADEPGIFKEQLKVRLCQGSQNPLLLGSDLRG